jgi:hypothetical protein
MLLSVIQDIFKGASRREHATQVATASQDAATGAPAAGGGALRGRAATIQLEFGGQAREFRTSVDLDDIEGNGVAHSKLMRRPFPGREGWVERLATLLNIATVCHDARLWREELAALRMARRMAGGAAALIDDRIAENLSRDAGATAYEGGLRVVAYSSEPRAFEALVGSTAIGNNVVHPGAEFQGLTATDGQLLYPPQPLVDNISFAICDGEERLAVVPCVVQGDDTISWVAIHLPAGGVPITINFDHPPRKERKVLQVVVEHLGRMLRSYGATHYVIREPFAETRLLYHTLGLSSTFAAELWDRPVVPLEGVDEAELFAGLRKSYKSHVNWGRDNLTMEYVSGDRLTDARVREVHELLDRCHEKLIQEMGNGMTPTIFMPPMVMCQRNHGEVAIARTRDGTACGVTVVTDAGGISHYTLGGSIPQQNKNPGQFIVYDAMLRAKARGSRCFHVNREYGAPVSMHGLQPRIQSVHDTNLIFFKRGFGGHLETFAVYKVFPAQVDVLGR